MIRTILRGVYAVGANRPLLGGRIRSGSAVRVLLAGAAVTWAISTLSQLADSVRAEVQELADERNRLLAEIAELRGDELLAQKPDEADDMFSAANLAEPAGDLPATGWFQAPGANLAAGDECGAPSRNATRCTLTVGHRGSHRDDMDRVWRRGSMPCDSVSPQERFTCRAQDSHDGPHVAGEYQWNDRGEWDENPDLADEADTARSEAEEASAAAVVEGLRDREPARE